MTIELRPYQARGYRDIHDAWRSGVRRVLYVLATGGGKTTIFGKILADNQGASCAIAHRQELVGQISLALCRYGIRHRIVGPSSIIKDTVRTHVAEFGRSYYDPNAAVGVAGVDTLIRRGLSIKSWAEAVNLWVNDEAHHVLRDNKWGRAIKMLPNARGLGVTATPRRADGRGVGVSADGIFEQMIEGPTAGELMDEGYLTGYRIIAPPSDFVRPGEDAIGSTGDIKLDANKAAVMASHIMGDVVKHYLKFTPGMRGIVFAVDIETATTIAANFRAAGVRADVISSKTPDLLRRELVARLRRGDLDLLVNVDIFGEGFDLPAVEVVIMARATESLALFLQQFGRLLRPIYASGFDLSAVDGRLAAIAASGKPRGWLIDHVGNVGRHLLPDSPRAWSLEGRTRQSRESDDAGIPVRTCANPECAGVYERFHKVCPYCGHKPEPESRGAPEFVDGDLLELDAETLRKMRGGVDRIDGPALIPAHLSPIAAAGARKKHAARQEAQAALRASIAWWAAYQRAHGREDSESYRRFFHTFGIDVLSAQTLGRPDALALAGKINQHLARIA